MKKFHLRPVEPDRDFAEISALFSLEQDEPTSETALKEDYEVHKERIFRLMVAEDEQGELLGFNWATRSRFDPKQAYIYVIVKPQHRGQGAGRRLYEDVEQAAKGYLINQLQVSICDNRPGYRAFAETCGFMERSHLIGMRLDLTAFDDWPFNGLISRLQKEGFQFTSMDAMGNTEEAQRKLYVLNDSTVLDDPGSQGQHSWLSFEDFQNRVCQSDWYKPAGQMVVIDSSNGSWAALSAITRFEGVDYAYNLHTGVDRLYRGRKLAQAVKVMALRYAREELSVSTAQTHHDSRNAPMIAIDRKLGYVQIPGSFTMVKDLD